MMEEHKRLIAKIEKCVKYVGLQWIACEERPQGKEVNNPALAMALQKKTTFSMEEWVALVYGGQLDPVNWDDYVIVKN